MRRFVGAVMLAAACLGPAVGWAQTEAEVAATEAAETAAVVSDAPVAYAPQVYTRGKVVSVLEDSGPNDVSGMNEATQVLLVRVLGGEDKGETVTVTYHFSAANYKYQHLKEGQVAVVAKVTDGRGTNYYVLDTYRLPAVLAYAALFVVAAVVLGRGRGLGSLLGLGASLIILMGFVVPQIIRGHSPLMISFLGAVAIAVVSLLLAHGFRRRTYVALAATLLALCVAFGLAILASWLIGLSGTGSEAAVYLQVGYLPSLNLTGLLLGGIVIGTLGVLDDVTTAQVAAIEEIGLANSQLGVMELYQRGISVGREHIASLVNTLILAYAGAAFPMFLLFALPDHPPIWIILNGEAVVEEVVRGLVGGLALMLAVPIATALAAAVFGSLVKDDTAGARSSHKQRLTHHH